MDSVYSSEAGLLGIFGRPLDHDTGQDSIVRAKVNEVRRRLAQYFDEAGATASVRIDVTIAANPAAAGGRAGV
jgi:hypothetical protein